MDLDLGRGGGMTEMDEEAGMEAGAEIDMDERIVELE